MLEIVKNCPLCQGKRHKEFARIDFRGTQVVNQRCLSCGFVFQSPRMTASELDDFYHRPYREIYQGDEGPTEKDMLTQRKRASSLLALFSETVQQLNHHLDIGCSAGKLLKVFQDHYGCRVTGVEPGESYRNAAISQGLTVYKDLAEISSGGETVFDLVSLAHVLEHLPDPCSYLSEIRVKYLTPSGWLLLEVPNLYCHDSFEIAHLSNFSIHTLKQTVMKAGFEVVAVKTHGHPRSRILPLYITLIARNCPGPIRKIPIRKESHVAIKRGYGMFRRRVYERLFPRSAWVSVLEDNHIQ
jgi:SAM-dependent methyltransferase